MADFGVQVTGDNEVRKILIDLPNTVFAQTKEAVRATIFAAQKTVVQNLTVELTPRSGTLRRSLRVDVSGDRIENLSGSLYIAAISKTLKYAKIHEFGGKIKAKDAYKGVPGGPYLNIPTEANKYPSGVTRRTAREIFNRGGYIRKSGRSWGVYQGVKKVFSLVKQVEIPPRLGMVAAVDEEIPNLMARLKKIELGGGGL